MGFYKAGPQDRGEPQDSRDVEGKLLQNGHEFHVPMTN